jgi:RNA polymerase sigma-70 factor (ECF subfamily)
MQTETLSQAAVPMPPVPAQYAAIDFSVEDLVSAARGGSDVAFVRLITPHKSRLLRHAQAIAANREDAEEAVQNALLKAFINMSRFRGDSSFSTWLVRITINEALMIRRGRRGIREVSVDDPARSVEKAEVLELTDSGPSPELSYSRAEIRRILASTITKLPLRYRLVFELREIEERSVQQTAAALDISQAAVKARLRRARMRLRTLLGDHLQGAGGSSLAAAARG